MLRTRTTCVSYDCEIYAMARVDYQVKHCRRNLLHYVFNSVETGRAVLLMENIKYVSV